MWHDPTLSAAVSEFCTKYNHSMQVYASQHNLHEKSLLSMFSTQGHHSELGELFLVLRDLSDDERARILKPCCDALGPVLDGTVFTDQQKAELVKNQLEKLIECLVDTPTQPWPVESG